MDRLDRCNYCSLLAHHVHILQWELAKSEVGSNNEHASLLELKCYYWLLDEYINRGMLSCNSICESGFRDILHTLRDLLQNKQMTLDIEKRHCDICKILPCEIFSLLDRACTLSTQQEIDSMYTEIQYHIFLSRIYEEMIGRCTSCNDWIEYIACLGGACEYIENKDLHQLQEFVYYWKMARNADELWGCRDALRKDIFIESTERPSSSKASIYLDFNVYDRYEKEPIVADFFNKLLCQGIDIICSGTHLEEILRMDNEEYEAKRIQSVQKLTQGKIVVVKDDGMLTVVVEDIIERLNLVRRYQKINSLAEERECIKAESRKHLSLHEDNEQRDKNIGSSSLQKMIENNKGLEAADPTLPDANDLNKILRYVGNGNQCIRDYQGMLKGDENTFRQIRDAIVSLAGLLNILGLHGDKVSKKNASNAVYPIYHKDSYRTIRSGYYDNDHLSFASKCMYFVTTDKKLFRKAKEIYNLLGIETIPILLADFMNEHRFK